MSELVALEDTAEQEQLVVVLVVVVVDSLVGRQKGSSMMAIVGVVDCNVRNLARSMGCNWAALRS